jgi:hypothetical protein
MADQISDLEAKLAIARRHVVNGQRIVARQYERIAALERDERPTASAESTLAVFLTTLRAFEEHERELRERADAAVRRCSEATPLWIDSATRPDRQAGVPASRPEPNQG